MAYTTACTTVQAVIVTQAGTTPSSTATVDKNITQQNSMLKLVTQFDINAKHSKKTIRSMFKMSPTSFADALSYCQRFSTFLTTYSDQKPSNALPGNSVISFAP